MDYELKYLSLQEINPETMNHKLNSLLAVLLITPFVVFCPTNGDLLRHCVLKRFLSPVTQVFIYCLLCARN